MAGKKQKVEAAPVADSAKAALVPTKEYTEFDKRAQAIEIQAAKDRVTLTVKLASLYATIPASTQKDELIKLVENLVLGCRPKALARLL